MTSLLRLAVLAQGRKEVFYPFYKDFTRIHGAVGHRITDYHCAFQRLREIDLALVASLGNLTRSITVP